MWHLPQLLFEGQDSHAHSHWLTGSLLTTRCLLLTGCLQSGPLHNHRLFTSAMRAPQIAADTFCLAKMRLRQLGRRLRRALECTSSAVSHWPSVKNARQLAFACAELSKRTVAHIEKSLKSKIVCNLVEMYVCEWSESLRFQKIYLISISHLEINEYN